MAQYLTGKSFLNKIEGLLQWCAANNIPIKTYSEWSDILYNEIPDPNENIIPPLNVDLDGNNIPDGYEQSGEGTLVKTDGVQTVNDYCYSISKADQICSITSLGGIEKGADEFEIWTKGAPGDYIEVTFKVGSQNLVYKFPAENNEWTRYNLTQSINGNTSLNIPENVSVIDVTVRCSNYSTGEVKISGMKFAKSLEINENLIIIPINRDVEYSAGSTTFDVTSNMSWTVSDNVNWLTVTPESGSNNGLLTATYSDNTTTNQREGTITVKWRQY